MHGPGSVPLVPIVSVSTAIVVEVPVSEVVTLVVGVDVDVTLVPVIPVVVSPPLAEVVGTASVVPDVVVAVVSSSEVTPVVAAVVPPPDEPHASTSAVIPRVRLFDRDMPALYHVGRICTRVQNLLDPPTQVCKLSGVRVTNTGEVRSGGDMRDGREERGDRTAQALLAAARTAFSRGGYAAASVRDIARAAGVNPALVRYHFGSKEGLYRKVIDEAMSGLRTRLLAAFHQAGAPRERIHRVIGAYLDHLAQERDFPRLIQRALLNNDPHLRRVAHEYLHPLVDTLRPFVGRRVASSLGSLEEVIVSVFGAIIAPFLYEPLLNDLFRRDVLSPAALKRRRRHIESLVELTLARLLPESP